MKTKEKNKIGIIGGSGFYDFLQGKEISIGTPYGKPSDKILLVEYADKQIAFLPRHDKKHQLPPHSINYRANLYALKKLGVERVLASTTVGSLRPEIKPGDFVICDQFIDRTERRPDTFFDGPEVVHISSVEPYCPELRQLAIEACQKINSHGRVRIAEAKGGGALFACHKTGTVVVIDGPRFSTKAESEFFIKMGWDIINMTQYPEVILARELEMCYLNISLVTDYDTGLKDRPDIKPVTAQEVMRVFKENNEKVKQIFLEIIKKLPEARKCQCGQALKEAKI